LNKQDKTRNQNNARSALEGAKLDGLLQALDIPRKAVAEAAGRSEAYLCRVIGGESEPGMFEAVKLGMAIRDAAEKQRVSAR
jgi:predicted transcriptional regulator